LPSSGLRSIVPNTSSTAFPEHIHFIDDLIQFDRQQRVFANRAQRRRNRIDVGSAFLQPGQMEPIDFSSQKRKLLVELAWSRQLLFCAPSSLQGF
jgi:hypothetical protein